jgi:8-oxo-dGTP pyrophosphatase MutT (NUDIX family)
LSGRLSPEQQLLSAELQGYRPADDVERQHRQDMLELVTTEELWWHRDTMPGHVTASAFVVSPDLRSLLLHHHRTLDRWLQFGGHDDGERHPAKAVLRELVEESGLQHFDFFGTPTIFDLDIHPIPESIEQPRHLHFDVRYLFVADPVQELLPAAGESELLRWMSIDEAQSAFDEAAGTRVCHKLRNIRISG